MSNKIEVTDLSQEVNLCAAIDGFLSKVCTRVRMDDEYDRRVLAAALAGWLLAERKVVRHSFTFSIPATEYEISLQIDDEVRGRTVLKLTCKQDQIGAVSEEILKMQVKFWTAIARLLWDNPEVVRELKEAGMEVSIDPPPGVDGC